MKSGTGKKIGLIAAIVCLLAALVGGGVFLAGRGENTAAVPTTADTDWYDENGKEFVITTEEELYGFAELSKTYSFKGQTVKLGADIRINTGDASKWSERAPDKLWTPIVGFAGTFDGQDHTISGVYGNSIVTSLGLFTDTQKGCVIKNLRLENSFFKNNNDMGTGSIIGVGGGTLKNIYSNAILSSNGKYVGGLVGNVKAKGENTISNCWFDGDINTKGYECSAVGGLVGAFSVEDAINTIEHCLSTADITCLGENVGGICGTVASGSFLNLNDSMFTGTLVYDTNKYAVVGSMLGTVAGSGSIIVNDSYTVDELANRTIGTSSGYQKGNAIALDKRYLKGAAGYQWTTLNFEKYWVAQKDGMPRLAYFTKATESIDGVQKMVDVSWYDPAGASFVINNVQQLYGFAYLSRSYDFRGQTIKLGADITVNEGKASEWRDNAPAYGWTPIAWYGSSLSQRFKGTFDGQGHTISGIYCKGTENITSLGLFGEVYHGAVVKNFKLVNSYFEGVLDSSVRGPVGSIAGRLRGTIQDVYSDAVIVNSAKNTGGIVGMVIGTGQNTISSCWFDGKIYGITRTGGILGGVYGNKGNIEATIEHCLNTGDINAGIGEGSVGGICGCAETWSILYINDCLNAGTFKTTGTGKEPSKHIGTILGTVTQTDGVGSKAVVTHSYGTKDFYSRLVGWKFEDEAVEQNSMMYVDTDELIGYGGYQWTTLNFNKYWAVRANDCPVPAVFAGVRPSVANVVRMVDYSWYDPDKDSYTITTMQQLYGAARLWEVTNLFVDKTILLGADITVNSGNAGDWISGAPAYVWEPMRLRGTFDGQGHTISGIYVKGGEEDNYIGLFHRVYQGGVVRNLRLTNSYFEGTMDSGDRGAVGSIAGRNNGIIDTVYSDAVVVNSARMTGGLVGMITGEGENQILNSWYNGGIFAINRTGGILGGMYGNKENISVTIKNCTNTGAISVKIGNGDVGGICGMAETGGTLYLINCVNDGIFQTTGSDREANTHIGSIFGSVTQKDGIASHVVLNNVYGTDRFYSKLVGWKYDAKGVSSTAAVLLDRDTLIADGGYRYAQLDYANTFGLNTLNVPVPAAFAATRVEGKNLVDYSWYDAAKSEYTLTTPAQLEAFGVLCNAENSYFSGKTVKLGADIKLSDDVTKLTAPNWTPVNFKGTFDGQNHAISGVYVKADTQYAGFFHTVETDAAVKNLKLTDSIIEGVYTGVESRAGVGSIAGRNRGVIDGVYSNAVVRNSKAMTGGIAGMSEGGTITHSWFDGEVHGARGTGGILGGSYAKAATIQHCLNTGKIIVADNTYYAGGIVGELQNAAAGTITDCLNAGTLTGAAVKSGAVVGRVDTKASLALNDSYGVSSFLAAAIGDCTGTLTGSNYAVRSQENLLGYSAYQWTSLDFDGGSWVLKKDAIPALGRFDTSDLSLEEAKKLPDYNWYDESKSEFVITTADQLLSFNELCSADNSYFKDKTFKLGADIKLCEDVATLTAANWQVKNFSGTFDGQGHSISGVYVNAQNQYVGLFGTVNGGATVKNLKLLNSRIEGNGPETRSGVGSIAGRSHGTIDTVYSNATLVNKKQMTGGIVGMVTTTGENKIVNCWFDGEITGISGTAGILGSSYGQQVTIEHCLNTGKLNVTSGSQVGGLCAYVQGAAKVTISDSLNAGELNAASGVKQIGSIVGAVHNNATLTLKNAYGVQEFKDGYLGYVDKGTVTDNGYAVRTLANIKGYGAYQWTKLDFDGGVWALKKDTVPVLSVFNTADLVEAADLSVEEAKKLPNYNWYDASKTEFEISSAEQLVSFGGLCNAESNYFNGKTVKLTADITLTGENNWTPVRFEGTFDGNGKTISGLNVKSTDGDAAFFAALGAGAAVKDLRIAAATFEGKTVGAIAAVAEGGTITGCMADAQLTGETAGGLVGSATGTTVEHCRFTGKVNGTAVAGGLIGSATGCTVNDSLAAAEVACTTAGAILGSADTTTLTNVYGTGGAAAVGTGTATGTFAVRKAADLNGYGAYQWTKLDFAQYWVLKKDALPELGKFAATDLDMAVAESMADYNWYDPAAESYVIGNTREMCGYAELSKRSDFVAKNVTLSADEYILSTADELMAFNTLCTDVTDFFNGKTIKLDADITLNEGGNAADWASAAPSVKWMHQEFKGIFDGAGHTISGVYVNAGTHAGFFKMVRKGAVVKNLKLVNSYIQNTKTSGRTGTGSIAGRSYGTIENVYSSAIVSSVKGAQMTGGIVGMIDAAGENKISNCWFDGEIRATGSTGGILGGTYAATATVEHCLFTGTVKAESGTAIGGLLGYAQSTGGVTLTDSLNAGAFVKGSGTIKQLGAVVGAVHANAVLTVGNAYGVTQFAEALYGYNTATNVTVQPNTNWAVCKLDDLKGYGAYQWTKLDFGDGANPGAWVLKKDAIPALSVFNTTDIPDLSVSDAATQPTYDWYDKSAESYTISNVQQMRGYAEICNRDDFVAKPVNLSASVYELSSAEQLHAFAELCKDNVSFASTTIRLSADIAFAGENSWTPVRFDGTFDGNGKTISGLEIKVADGSAGIFSKLESGAAVKNLQIADSRFEGKIAGAVAAEANGASITDCVVNAQVIGETAGGIIGSSADTTVEQCRFTGTVNGTAVAGGLVGASSGDAVKHSQMSGAVTGETAGGLLGTAAGTAVEHCLAADTGAVSGSSAAGGLIGSADSSCTVSDSLSAATVTAAAAGAKAGVIVGVADNTALTNVYGVVNDAAVVALGEGETAAAAIGEGTAAGTYAVKAKSDLVGYGAYQWTGLDFDGGNWVLKADALPALAKFDVSDLSLDAAKPLPDYTWYDAAGDSYVLTTGRQLDGYVKLSAAEGFEAKPVTLGSDTYTLSTADQLMAFNTLCTDATDFFNGKTLKLDADITLNEGGNAADWASAAPSVKWVNQEFKGVFDGAGHTISGVYVSSGTHAGFFKMVHKGAVVKNLKLVNSYIQTNKTSGRTGTGSIAGRSYGTIENVYSSAIVSSVKGALMTGGIVGMIDAAGENKISNCWFDGEIRATGSTGGILGGTYAATATVEHCLFTGTVKAESGTAIGGLLGYAQSTGGVTLTDSLNAGAFVKGSGTIKQLGAIAGAVHASATLTVENAYGATEFGTALYGYSKNNVTIASGAVCEAYALADLCGAESKADKLSASWTKRDGKIPMLAGFTALAESLGK